MCGVQLRHRKRAIGLMLMPQKQQNSWLCQIMCIGTVTSQEWQKKTEEESMKAVRARKIHCADQRAVLVLTRLPLGGYDSHHPHLLGMLPDFKHCSHPFSCKHHNFRIVQSSPSNIIIIDRQNIIP